MSKSSAAKNSSYELKHRLTGAIVLVLLAVVIIPLLLSEPAIEASSKDSAGLATSKGAATSFRSRIVPLDISNVNQRGDNPVSDLATTRVENARPALLDLTGDTASSSPQGATSASTEGQSKSSDNQLDDKAVAEVPIAPESGNDKPAIVMTPATETTNKVAESKQTEEPVKVAAADPQPEKKKPAQEPATVADGWIVRVGAYSKKSGVEDITTKLSQNGYKPKTTEEVISVGKVTRVWLGPYENRAEADRISEQVKPLTGEKGYVIRSSS